MSNSPPDIESFFLDEASLERYLTGDDDGPDKAGKLDDDDDDDDGAEEWYEKAMTSAAAYANTYRLVEDHEEFDAGNRLLRRAARAGHVPAVFELGHRLLRQVQNQHDTTKRARVKQVGKAEQLALALLRKAAQADHGQANYELWDHCRSLHMPFYPWQCLEQAAQKGHTRAMYFWAYNLDKDLDSALIFLEKAAHDGHCRALFDLAKLYSGGKPYNNRNIFQTSDKIKVDHVKAQEYYQRILEQKHVGDTEILHEMARMYTKGDAESGIEKDPPVAWECFKREEHLRLVDCTQQRPQWKMKEATKALNLKMRSSHNLVEALKTGAIKFLHGTWLVDYASSSQSNVIPHRQALPPEAFLAYDDVVQLLLGYGHFEMVALSYMWLDKAHPDPKGETLQLLARELRNVHNGKTWAVFWDYASLHQHPGPDKGERRTETEEKFFRQGLMAMADLYSHPEIQVFMVQEFPPNNLSTGTCNTLSIQDDHSKNLGISNEGGPTRNPAGQP